MMRSKVNKKKQVPTHLLSNKQYENQSGFKSKRGEISQPIHSIVFENNEIPLNQAAEKKEPKISDASKTHRAEVCHSRQEPLIKNKHSGPRYSFSTDIPDKYDDFYICVLPRDPQWLYVYWEFPDGKKGPDDRRCKFNPNTSQLILRVKEAPSDPLENKGTQFDVPINITDNNWYVKIPETGRNCLIECGHLSADGSFTSFASTSHFTSPSPATVKSRSHFESSETQSQLLIEFTNNSNAVRNIAHFHDRSKTIPLERSNKGLSGSEQTSNISDLENASANRDTRYLGSAAIN